MQGVECETGAPGRLAFDLFLIFARADAAFVRNVLLPGLELPVGRTLLVDELTLGASRVAEIERGVCRSRFTVVVLSPAYLADGWAAFGEELASHLSVSTPRVIPLRLSDCELPVRLDSRVALDFRRDEDRELELSRLRRLLETSSPDVAVKKGGQTDLPSVSSLPGRAAADATSAPRFARRAAPWVAGALLSSTLGWSLARQRPRPAETELRMKTSAGVGSAPLPPLAEAPSTGRPFSNGVAASAASAARTPKPSSSALATVEARNKLAQLGLSFTAAVFFERVVADDALAAGLFLAAGMDPDTLGHDPNLVGVQSPSVLAVAAYHGQVELAKLLLDAGADLESAFFVASRYDSRVLPLFLSRSPSQEILWSGVASAASAGEMKVLSELLARVQDVPHQGAAALAAATSGSQLDAVRVLLDAGAPVDQPDWNGETPLLRAARAGRADVLELLIARGASVAFRSPTGDTALHIAAGCIYDAPGLSDAAVARALLAHGADIAAKNTSGETPLALARGRNDRDRDELRRLLGKSEAGPQQAGKKTR